MSKAELKKHLQSLPTDQVIEQAPELYGNCKPAKGYFVLESAPSVVRHPDGGFESK
jgi:hypothetical protein